MIRVTMHYFLFCGLTWMLWHFTAVKRHISLYQPRWSLFCARERNDRKLGKKLKYEFCCESHVLLCMEITCTVAALIFCLSNLYIRELDEFFQSSWLINAEANYWRSPMECAHTTLANIFFQVPDRICCECKLLWAVNALLILGTL